jgi:hypothetical protein
VQLRKPIIAVWLCALCCGCADLGEFKTGPDDVFRGEVVGSDSEQSGDSFIRKGFASHTLLELRFNPNASGVPISSDAGEQARRRAVPGMVHTYLCQAGKTSCAEDARTLGPFDRARLLPIDGLAHDTLSQYTFPGGGRLHNYIFSVRFSAETDEGRVARDAMIFVSLMETEQIEVRAIAPSVLNEQGDAERLPALFGVFVLARQRD